MTAGGYFGQALVVDAATGASGIAVVAKSPLTGMLTDALASRQFAIAGKLTGHDAIVMRGKAPRLSVLLVDGDGTRLVDARHLAGHSAALTDTELRAQLGRGWRVAAIGPAGEHGVRYATVSHDGRHAGRGGLGAVMGVKNVKAIAVRAAAKVATADPRAVLAAARDLRERSFGPATEKYRELGTLANLLAFNAIATLPTRNFQAAEFEGADRLAAQAGPAPAVRPGRRAGRAGVAAARALVGTAAVRSIQGVRRGTRRVLGRGHGSAGALASPLIGRKICAGSLPGRQRPVAPGPSGSGRRTWGRGLIRRRPGGRRPWR